MLQSSYHVLASRSSDDTERQSDRTPQCEECTMVPVFAGPLPDPREACRNRSVGEWLSGAPVGRVDWAVNGIVEERPVKPYLALEDSAFDHLKKFLMFRSPK